MESIKISKEEIKNNMDKFMARTTMTGLADKFFRNHSILTPLDESLKNPDFVIFALQKEPELFNYIPENYKTDKNFLLKAITRSSGPFLHTQYSPESIIKYVEPEIKNDTNFMLEAIKVNKFALSYAPEEIRNNKEFMLKAVKYSPVALSEASPSLQDDKELVLTAIKINKEIVKYASDRLKTDMEIVESIADNITACKYLTTDLQKSAEKIRFETSKRQEKMRQFIKNNPTVEKVKNIKRHMDNIIEITELMKEFYTSDNRPLFSESLKDPNFALYFVKKDGGYLKNTSQELKNNKEIVLEAVKNDGAALYYASEELKNDREIVLEAVKNDGKALYYASEELKNDKEIVYYAIKNNSGAIFNASKNLQEFTLEKGLEQLITPNIHSKISDVLGKFRTFLKPSENTATRKFG